MAVAVERAWYETIAKHKFLKGISLGGDHPTDLITATIDDLESLHGIWVKPDERLSDFSRSALFIPWEVIVSAVLLDADDETKVGFA